MNEEEADEPDRTKRVKEARDEAKKEIDEYKKNKEEEFKKFESEVRSFCQLFVKSRGRNENFEELG